MILAAVVVVALSQFESGSGVQREQLKEWNNGPGKTLGLKAAKAKTTELQKHLELVKNGRINSKIKDRTITPVNGRPVMFFPDSKSKTQYRQEVERLIEESKNKEKDPYPGYPALVTTRLKVGAIGQLEIRSNDGFRVAIVGYPDDALPVTVRQIVDANNAIIHLGPKPWKDPVVVWITTPTKGMVDDHEYDLGRAIVEVIGTKQYDTVSGGTKTIFHLVTRTADELASR